MALVADRRCLLAARPWAGDFTPSTSSFSSVRTVTAPSPGVTEDYVGSGLLQAQPRPGAPWAPLLLLQLFPGFPGADQASSPAWGRGMGAEWTLGSTNDSHSTRGLLSVPPHLGFPQYGPPFFSLGPSSPLTLSHSLP